MSIKTTGKIIKEFYDELHRLHVEHGIWYVNEILVVDGVTVKDASGETRNNTGLNGRDVSDSSKIIIADGLVLSGGGERINTFERYFKKWKQVRVHIEAKKISDYHSEERNKYHAIFGDKVVIFKDKIVEFGFAYTENNDCRTLKYKCEHSNVVVYIDGDYNPARPEASEFYILTHAETLEGVKIPNTDVDFTCHDLDEFDNIADKAYSCLLRVVKRQEIAPTYMPKTVATQLAHAIRSLDNANSLASTSQELMDTIGNIRADTIHLLDVCGYSITNKYKVDKYSDVPDTIT